MTIRKSDRDILDFLPSDGLFEENEPVFSAPKKLDFQDQQKQEDRVFSKEEEQFYADVKDALDASSGVQKLLKSLYGDQAVVSVREDETRLLGAIRNVFGRSSNQITFQMYEQALGVLKEQSQEIYKEVI